MTVRTHIGKQEETQEERSIQMRPSDPGSPEVDQLWLNTTEGRVKYFNGVSIIPTVSSASNKAVRTETANYSLQPADDIVIGDASSGDITMTLPTAASASGKKYIFTKVDSSANKVIIDPDGVETVDGSSTAELQRQYQTLEILSDGTKWITTSSNIIKYRRKVLTAAVTTNTAISDLGFSSLEVGKVYEISGTVAFDSDGTDGEFKVQIKNGVTILGEVVFNADLSGNSQRVSAGFSIPFTASDTSLTLESTGLVAGHSIVGTAADGKTYSVLKEQPMYQETTQWG